LTSDGETPLLKLNGASGLAQSLVGNAQVAEHTAFRIALLRSPCSGEHRFQPLNPLARALAQTEHIRTGIRIFDAESGGCFVLANWRARGPLLPSLDIRPLPIKQRQPAPDPGATLEVEILGVGKRRQVMRRMLASVLFTLSFTESRAGEEPRQVVQEITPGPPFIERKAASHQLAQALVARVFTDRLFRSRVEGAAKNRQATEDTRRLGLQPRVAQVE